MGIDVDDQTMGRLLYLPVGTVAGDTVALRREVIAVLRERRVAVVEEMSAAVRRAGLAALLELGHVAVERRLDAAVRTVLDAWEQDRPLRAGELEALRQLGLAVGRTGSPLWRLLSAVHHAARAGWDYAVAQALAVVEESGRPRLAARLVGELSVNALELATRAQAQLAAGYGEAAPLRRATGANSGIGRARETLPG
jgi:hypothetical protein